jgi:hypothetical protein
MDKQVEKKCKFCGEPTHQSLVNGFKISGVARRCTNCGSQGPVKDTLEACNAAYKLYRKESKPIVIEKDSDAYRLSQELYTSIKKSVPDVQIPDFQAWSKVIDLLIRKDNRKVELVREVVEWLPDGPFWGGVILSAGSLRKNFDKLLGAKSKISSKVKGNWQTTATESFGKTKGF